MRPEYRVYPASAYEVYHDSECDIHFDPIDNEEEAEGWIVMDFQTTYIRGPNQAFSTHDEAFAYASGLALRNDGYAFPWDLAAEFSGEED
jgi:hypothetical protein